MSEQDAHDWEDFKLRHEAAVGYAQSTLRTLTLINGGALIALLTFVGNNNAAQDKIGMFWSFTWFSIGLVSSTIAHGLAYFVQESYLNSSVHRMEGLDQVGTDLRGNKLLLGAALCCLVSLILFVVGVFVALEAIT